MSEGYSAKRGFLESLPIMKVRLTADEQHGQFFEVLRSETAAGRLIEFEGNLVQMPHEMDDVEIGRVLTSFDAQRLGIAKPEHKFFFSTWAIERGTTLPLGLTLTVAIALIIFGMGVLISEHLRHQQTASPPMASAEQTTRPEPSQVQTPIRRSRLRFALHLWGGVCLKLAADVGGIFPFSRIFPVRGGLDIESAAAVASAAGLAAVLFMVASYYLSYQLVSALDKSSLSPKHKKSILILLPFAYFVGAILLGGVVGLFTGTAR